MSTYRTLRRLVPTLVLLAVLALGATAPAAAAPAPASARPVAMSVTSPAAAPDDADDHDDDFGWGPSRVVWGGFGWLGVVLVSALLLRRRASRRR